MVSVLLISDETDTILRLGKWTRAVLLLQKLI